MVNNNLLVAKTICQVNHNKGVVKICNPTDTQITLANNAIVASVECIDSDNILPFKSPNEATAYGVQSHILKGAMKKPLDFDLSSSDLTKAEKESLKSFLNNYMDVFATDLSELGKTLGRFSHKIETYDAPPVRMPFYRQPPHMQKEIDKQVQDLLDNDIIEESNSEYHSPVVLVKKKDGKFRFCVDYRKLNKITKPLSFPLPRLECVFDTVAEAQSQIFSTFDLHSGYWQLQMDPETKHKAAFITQKSL